MMPQYAFRATDRMGNAVEGNVSAADMSGATRQIQEMGYTPVSVQALVAVAAQTAPPVPRGAAQTQPVAVPPASNGTSRRMPVDLTQPVTEMPEAAVDLFAPSTPIEMTQQITPEEEPSLASYQAPGPDSKMETAARFARLEPWERGGPLPEPPAPTVQMTAQMATAGTGTTQPMSAFNHPSERPIPGSSSAPQLVRGLENIPFGANSKRNVSLSERFKEVMIYPVFSGVVLKDVAPFYRQLATLIGAGLPLFQSLVALEANTKNSKLKEVAGNGAKQVQAGGRFSDVLAAYPWIFPPMHLEMMRASEQGGMIEQVLRQIGDYVEHEIEIRRLVNRETLYPKIVLFVLMMLMGRPGIFEGSPAIVELVLGNTAGYFRDTVGFGLLFLVPLLVLVVFFRLFWFNIPSFRNGYDAFKINLPVLGKLIRMFAVAKFARTYAALSRAGFPVGAALQIAGDASGNVVIARAAQRAMREADRGVMPSVALSATGQFPHMAMDMLRTGEMSGGLDDMMERVADYQEAEAKMKSRQTAVIFSVIVLLIVGLVVLKVAMSFYGGYGAGLSSQM